MPPDVNLTPAQAREIRERFANARRGQLGELLYTYVEDLVAETGASYNQVLTVISDVLGKPLSSMSGSFYGYIRRHPERLGTIQEPIDADEITADLQVIAEAIRRITKNVEQLHRDNRALLRALKGRE